MAEIEQPARQPVIQAPIAAARARAMGVPEDGRLPARVRADGVWQGGRASLVARFGETQADRLLPLPDGASTPVPAPWDQPDGVASQSLDVALERERVLLTSAALGGTAATLKALEVDFFASVAAWLNLATKGWESRSEFEQRQAREREEG